jgi:hypothetical protein
MKRLVYPSRFFILVKVDISNFAGILPHSAEAEGMSHAPSLHGGD